MKIDTLAAIDIGSNAIRLMICNIEKRTKKNTFKKLALIRVPLRLGEDVFAKGEISEDKKERLCQAMLGFSHLMIAYNVIDYRACATSAMREASNNLDVVQAVSEISGINIDILEGEEEANHILNASAVRGKFDDSRTYLYVDVGGGSTELVVYSKGEKLASKSFKIGTVRQLLGNTDRSEKQHFKIWLKEAHKKYAPDVIIGSGGNINKVHKMLLKKLKDPVTYSELKELYTSLKGMTNDDRMSQLGLNPYRSDVIIPAMKLFLTVAKECHIHDIMVPKVGLPDGVIFDLYEKLYTK